MVRGRGGARGHLPDDHRPRWTGSSGPQDVGRHQLGATTKGPGRGAGEVDEGRAKPIPALPGLTGWDNLDDKHTTDVGQ